MVKVVYAYTAQWMGSSKWLSRSILSWPNQVTSDQPPRPGYGAQRGHLPGVNRWSRSTGPRRVQRRGPMP